MDGLVRIQVIRKHSFCRPEHDTVWCTLSPRRGRDFEGVVILFELDPVAVEEILPYPKEQARQCL
jgi:hypothetical protein